MNFSAARTRRLLSAPAARPACGPGSCKPGVGVERLAEDQLGRAWRRPARCPCRLRWRPSAPGRPRPRSTTMPRYSSRAMLQPSSTSTWWTVCPSGPVWIGDQRMAQQVRGGLAGPPRRLWTSCTPCCVGLSWIGPLAAAAGVDLGLDHRHRAAELAEGSAAACGRVGHDAPRHGHAGLAQDLLGLEFVDFHGILSVLLTLRVRFGLTRSVRSTTLRILIASSSIVPRSAYWPRRSWSSRRDAPAGRRSARHRIRLSYASPWK